MVDYKQFPPLQVMKTITSMFGKIDREYKYKVMEGNEHDNNCFNCRQVFDEIITVIQCTTYKHFIHGKSENVDMRVFYMEKRMTWKCKSCEAAKGEGNLSRTVVLENILMMRI